MRFSQEYFAQILTHSDLHFLLLDLYCMLMNIFVLTHSKNKSTKVFTNYICSLINLLLHTMQ